MLRCAHCRQPMTGLDDLCPACGRPRDERWEWGAEDRLHDRGGRELAPAEHGSDDSHAADPTLVAIAKFKSAAEAGYFAHELHQLGPFRVALSVEENFDAVGGRWSARFVLSVPESAAAESVAALETLIAETGGDECAAAHEAPARYASFAEGSDRRIDDWAADESDEIGSSGVNWLPIVLTLAAGSAALWGARKLQFPPAGNNGGQIPVRGQRVDLWDHLSDQPLRPWIQQLENGRGLRELRIEPGNGPAVLREDADGDGVFETEWQFRRSGRNW